MACDDVDLGKYYIGDDLEFGFEFFDYDENDNLVGPSNLAGHTFHSQVRYDPADQVAFDWTVTVAEGNKVLGVMDHSVSINIKPGKHWWSLKDNGHTIMQGRVPFETAVTR